MTPDFFKDNRHIALLALAACFLWGSAFPAIKYGYLLFDISAGDVSAQILFAGCRFAAAGLMVLFLARLGHQALFSFNPRDWGRLALLGLLMTSLQYAFFYVGLASTSGVKGSILNSSCTFFSVILAHFFYQSDRLNRHTISGCFLGFLGVMAVNRGAAGGLSGFSLTGEGFLIMASLCYSAAGIYGKMISQRINPLAMTGWQLFIGGLALSLPPLALGQRLNFSPAGAALLGYMAFLSAAAFALYAVLLKYNPVSKVSIYNFSIPIFGVLLSALVLGENLWEWENIAAMLLVCSGIFIVTVK